MSSDEIQDVNMVHLLPPWFDVTVSINGHLRKYSLHHSMYSHLLEEEDDVDPLNFAAVWLYITRNLYHFVLPLTEEFGSIDPDRVKLVALSVNVLAAPYDLDGIIDCDDCQDNYQDALDHATGEDEDDDDD